MWQSPLEEPAPVINVLLGIDPLTQEKSARLVVWLELCWDAHVVLVAGLDQFVQA